MERYGGRRLARELGPVAAWSFALQQLSAADAASAITSLETEGYGSVWIPESVGSKEIFSHASILLAATTRVAVATGIANIYARDPMAMANGAKALAEAYPGRFILGLGVSHASSVARRGGDYGKPVTTMRAYLEAMAAAPYSAPAPATAVPTVLAALGPRMLDLAAECTDGAHPYFVPVEHTAIARERLGAQPFLAVEQVAVLASEADAGRGIGRAFAQNYLAQPNYVNNLRRLGWSDPDLASGGSDRLIDAIVAWGDVEAIVARVEAHLDAGADQVCIQVRTKDPADPAIAAFGELATAFSLR